MPVQREVFLEVRAEAKVEVATAVVMAAVATEGAVMVAEEVVMVEVAMAADLEEDAGLAVEGRVAADLAGLEEVAALVVVALAAGDRAVGLALVGLVAGDLVVGLALVAEAVPQVVAEEALVEVVAVDRRLFGKHCRSWLHSLLCWSHFYNKAEDEAQYKTLADKPVEVKEEEEDLAIWDLADKAAVAAQEVTVADVQEVTAADEDQVAMVAAADAMVVVTVAAVVVTEEEVEMVAVVTVAVDATVEAVVMEGVAPEWEEEACLDLVKVVLHNQRRKSGTQAYLIP